ncbi:hypothetical protein L7F22_038923 [Adiantum nelumboides]|nr:hypothetical protein [Adiantum nelumboides]
MASRSSQGVHALLDKMSSPDADFRYMALSDLIAEANRGMLTSVENRVQMTLLRKVLDLVRDQNGEVKNMSVKCLGTLVQTSSDEEIRLIIDSLVEYISSKEDELRDIASLGLKTVMSQIPVEGDQAIMAADKLVPRLLSQISDPSASQELLIDSLDVLADYFSRFPHAISNDAPLQRNAIKVILGALSNNRATVRKRAIQAISALAPFAISEVFTKLSESIALALSSNKEESIKINVQLLGLLAKTSSRRLGRRLPEFMPRIMTILTSEQAQEDDELREICLQALDNIVLNCPSEVTPFVIQIVESSVSLLKHDPNYAGGYESDEEMDAEDGYEDEGEDDDFIDDDQYSDEDDVSWKVRRGAAKLLAGIIATRSEMLPTLTSGVAPALVSRFTEREESVRNEVLNTFSTLLQQVRLHGSGPQTTEVLRNSPGALKRKWEADAAIVATEGSPLSQIMSLKPALAKALSKTIVSKTVPTRLASYVVLRDLIIVLHGGLDEHIGLLVTQTEKALKGAETSTGPSTSIKTEILIFLNLLFRYHRPEFFDQYLDHLVPFIAAVITDKLQRETIEGFRVASELVAVLRAPSISSTTSGKYKAYIEKLYTAIMVRLERSDSDQEIKEKGIDALSNLLAFAGDDLQEHFPKAFAHLYDRLKNETTRLAAVRAITSIVSSSICEGDLVNQFATRSISPIAEIVRQNNRALRIASFDGLNALLIKIGKDVPEDIADHVVDEINPLLQHDSNISLLPSALEALSRLVENGHGIQAIQTKIIPHILKLIRSPLLQGTALASTLRFFEVLLNASPVVSNTIIESLDEAALTSQDAANQTYFSQVSTTLAQCYAIVAKCVPNASTPIVKRAKSIFTKKGAKDADVYFHLLLIGELARFTNFSKDKSLFDDVLRFYEADSDDVKSAAAFAVGNMAVGNLEKFLPIIEEQMHEEKHSLLALHALKELITHGSPDQLEILAKRIWQPLFEICAAKDEAIRNIGAECLARLILTNPAQYLGQLQARIRDPAPSTRASVVAAIRFTLTDTSAKYDDLLSPRIVEFLGLLSDESLEVRKPAMFAFNAAAHNRPALIRDHLPILLPMLYKETIPRQELLRKVSMGPFTVTTDDGLDLRKNAFETMYTLLDTCFSKINLTEYIQRVIAGMRDEDGIKVLCSLMFVRLASLAPTQVAQHLDDIVEPITSTLKVKLKDQATKQDVEKSTELQRSLFRAMVALDKTPHSAPKFQALVRDAKHSSQLYREVEQSSLAATNGQREVAMDLDG